MLSAAGGCAGKSPPQRSPEHVCDCHETQRTERDRGKEKTSRDGFELAGELRRSFALRDPQDCGFRFGDGVQLASEMNQIGCARRQSGPQATLIITWRNHSGLPCAGRRGGWHAHCRCRLRAGNRDNACRPVAGATQIKESLAAATVDAVQQPHVLAACPRRPILRRPRMGEVWRDYRGLMASGRETRTARCKIGRNQHERGFDRT